MFHRNQIDRYVLGSILRLPRNDFKIWYIKRTAQLKYGSSQKHGTSKEQSAENTKHQKKRPEMSLVESLKKLS